MSLRDKTFLRVLPLALAASLCVSSLAVAGPWTDLRPKVEVLDHANLSRFGCDASLAGYKKRMAAMNAYYSGKDTSIQLEKSGPCLQLIGLSISHVYEAGRYAGCRQQAAGGSEEACSNPSEGGDDEMNALIEECRKALGYSNAEYSAEYGSIRPRPQEAASTSFGWYAVTIARLAERAVSKSEYAVCEACGGTWPEDEKGHLCAPSK